MQNVGFGDLATTFRNMGNFARIKVEHARHSEELSSGRVADLRQASGGTLDAIAGLEIARRELESYTIAANEAAMFTGSIQVALDNVQQHSAKLASNLLIAGNQVQETLIQTSTEDAKGRLGTVIALLNTKLADRALFAGTNVNSNAMVDLDTMLGDLMTSVAAETTAAGVETAVEAWFDTAGGGFETVAYIGSDDNLQPFRVSQSEEIDFPIRADDHRIRNALKGYAMAALVADGVLAGDVAQRSALTQIAAEHLLTSDHDMAELRGEIGVVEARIGDAQARNSAEDGALESALATIVAVDPYEAATRLQQAEAQLAALYAVTARTARLSLVEYI